MFRPAQRILHAFSRKAAVNAVPPGGQAEPQSASRAAAPSSSSASGALAAQILSGTNDSKLAPFLSGYAPESSPEEGGLQFYLDDELAPCPVVDTTPKAMFARAVHVPWSAPGVAQAGPGAQLERTVSYARRDYAGPVQWVEALPWTSGHSDHLRTRPADLGLRSLGNNGVALQVRRLLTELALSQTPQAAATAAADSTRSTAGGPAAGAPTPAAAMQDLGALSERLRQAGLRVVVTSPARPRANSPLTTRSISSPFLLVIRQTGDTISSGSWRFGCGLARPPESGCSRKPWLQQFAWGTVENVSSQYPGHKPRSGNGHPLNSTTGCAGDASTGARVHRGRSAAGEVEVVVVDVALREHLAVAPSTPAYERTLAAAVPEMFIGSLSRLSELVRSMASAIQLNFSSQGVCVPPWRRTQALLSRWSVAEDIERQVRLQQRTGGGPMVDVEALAAASAVAAAGTSRQHLGHGGGGLAAPPAPLAAQPPLPLHPLLLPLQQQQLGLETEAAAATAATNSGAGGAHRPPPAAPADLPWAWQLRLQAPQPAERRHELDAAMAAAVAAAGAAGAAEPLPEGQVHGGFSAAGRQAANRPAMVVLGFVVPSAVEREEQAAAAAAAAASTSVGRLDCAGRPVPPRARDAWGAEMRSSDGIYGRASSAAASGAGSTSTISSTSGSTDCEEASGARSPTSVFRDHRPAVASPGKVATAAVAVMSTAGAFGTLQGFTAGLAL
eukprot:XP_001703544.1 predicted PWR protein [Chlamydomonas reinhardtii]